ncbi:hypothetical protein GH714_030151 [Hevea brasiliensis]|uniref:Uncharacterized protein n=1 Tax=Hevea brasiliensis TaxID=3981 RepID=A0A6A6M504_HEVBR|nr:hypothetical protein GH714_030151 [Hevea brasiliensis]
MNAREGVNVEEGNPNRSGVNAQVDDELHDNEYEMEEGDEDVQDVHHGINAEVNNDSNNQKQNQKGRPKATEERMRNEGIRASLRFDVADIDSEYGDLDELHSNSDSEGDGGKVRFPEFNMDRDINDPTFKVGLIGRIKDDYNISISMAKAWRVKDHASKRIHGDEAAQYGTYGGQLFSAIGIDPNDWFLQRLATLGMFMALADGLQSLHGYKRLRKPRVLSCLSVEILRLDFCFDCVEGLGTTTSSEGPSWLDWATLALHVSGG